MSSVAVIDYGMGNLHSIAKALSHVDPTAQVIVTSDASLIASADRVVFPGVGAIRDCMHALIERGLVDVIRRAVSEKPLLGICLGMQALLTRSEENDGVECLDIVPGMVVRFREDCPNANNERLKVPHMGWNTVMPRIDHPLWHGIEQGTRFYFVHSYYARPADAADVAATSRYPTEFAAAIAHGNLMAVQFHPEKSQSAGLALLANFLRWKPN